MCISTIDCSPDDCPYYNHPNDREKVIRELKTIRYNLRQMKHNLLADYCDDAIALLKEQEAKTGKWERQYSRPGVYANLFWWCSICGEPTRYNDAGIFYQYCPHCGAKLEPCKET